MEAADGEEQLGDADVKAPPNGVINELRDLGQDDNIQGQVRVLLKNVFQIVLDENEFVNFGHRWRSFWALTLSTMRRKRKGSTTVGRGSVSSRMWLQPVLEPWLSTVFTWVSGWREGCWRNSGWAADSQLFLYVLRRSSSDAALAPLWHDLQRGEVQQPRPGGHRPQDTDGHQCHAHCRSALHPPPHQVDIHSSPAALSISGSVEELEIIQIVIRRGQGWTLVWHWFTDPSQHSHSHLHLI